jgi:hypothetical protein
MESSSLDALPAEVLYRMLISVGFSYQNFRALTSTSRRIDDLVKASRPRIFGDIAAIQYPHALDAQRYPMPPCPKDSTISSLFQRNSLRTSSILVREKLVRCVSSGMQCSRINQRTRNIWRPGAGTTIFALLSIWPCSGDCSTIRGNPNAVIPQSSQLCSNPFLLTTF